MKLKDIQMKLMKENITTCKNIERIRDFWNTRPCNSHHSQLKKGTKDYFDEVEEKKHFVEPHILSFADFPKWRGLNVLEIGCGIGTAAVNFVRNGANYTGVELSEESFELTKQRLDIYNLRGDLYNINAEDDLSFLGFNSFDLVYSFGVIHHTPNPEKIVQNVHKLLKPGGTFKLMLYAKNSWKKMFIDRGMDQYEAQNECPLAYTYTKQEVHDMLKDFHHIDLFQTHIFPYKIEPYKNNVYIKENWFSAMPDSMFKILEEELGWHLCITCNK